VHPTGFVHAEDPDNKTKFLCGEALRGEGGLLLNSQGRRFVNELDLRDAVTAKMNEQSGRKYIVLNAKAAVDLGAHLGFYTFKKLMKKYDSSRALAEDLGMDPEALAAELKAYNRSAEQKCDAFNKTVFPAVPFETDEEYYAGEVTPVLHYTMGGIRMNPKAQIMRQGPGGDLQVIHRLYGAGEVTGGVHGNNRLGGNSLLECVVFGRIAGATAVADLAAEDKRA
jgi:succinate dehydrogenase/fumarate reductase flavoprotein subunit